MDDPLLMGMLDGVANLDEQIQPVFHAHAVLVAVIGDFDAIDQLHHEVRPASFGRTSIQNPRDVGVIH
jgi:hypothetical protein